MADIPRALARRCRADVAVFAETLVGAPLWPHQLEAARSDARIRCICSGRQAGKTRTLAVAALHCAYAGRDRRVLVVSAGEEAAKDVLAEVAALCSSPLLAGSVVDDGVTTVTLSNGSTVRSVPASTRQIRGKAVDLLVLDEAAFIAEEIWQAGKYTVLARPGSKVVMASTPYGRRDRFFAVHYRAGLVSGEVGVSLASFHWPSTVSPLVDRDLLELWRQTSTEREYRAEVLAEWVDEAGAYFSADELDDATVDYDLVPPDAAAGKVAGGAYMGVDWGFASDANALVVVAPRRGGDPGGDRGPDGWWLPWLDERFRLPYARFIDRAAAVAAAFPVAKIVSECNGVGQMPSQELARAVRRTVVPHSTTAESKENGFGTAKLLIQQQRLTIPRDPRLLRQLHNLDYEVTEAGAMRISVPERAGHDDLAMALCLAFTETPARRMVGRSRKPKGRRVPELGAGVWLGPHRDDKINLPLR